MDANELNKFNRYRREIWKCLNMKNSICFKVIILVTEKREVKNEEI